MQQYSVSPREGELNAFIDCLASIGTTPYRSRRDYTDAIVEAARKGAIPDYLLELCSAVRNVGAECAEDALDHAAVRLLPETFVNVVSELSGVSPAPMPLADDNVACAGATPAVQDASQGACTDDTASSGQFCTPAYRGFIDGV
ncbi:MAG TPA: hypothetical protein VF450_05395 [Noviherbaspirillum sp.]